MFLYVILILHSRVPVHRYVSVEGFNYLTRYNTLNDC